MAHDRSRDLRRQTKHDVASVKAHQDTMTALGNAAGHDTDGNTKESGTDPRK